MSWLATRPQVDLFDDIADGMTYCNHFFAPMEVPITDLAGAHRHGISLKEAALTLILSVAA